IDELAGDAPLSLAQLLLPGEPDVAILPEPLGLEVIVPGGSAVHPVVPDAPPGEVARRSLWPLGSPLVAPVPPVGRVEAARLGVEASVDAEGLVRFGGLVWPALPWLARANCGSRGRRRPRPRSTAPAG